MTPSATSSISLTRTQNQAADELAKLVSGETLIRRGEPLARRTTLRVGGSADLYVEPASEADLAAVLGFCRRFGEPFFCWAGARIY